MHACSKPQSKQSGYCMGLMAKSKDGDLLTEEESRIIDEVITDQSGDERFGAWTCARSDADLEQVTAGFAHRMDRAMSTGFKDMEAKS